jgi:hypothetical protein
MFDRQTTSRRLVRWKAALSPHHEPHTFIESTATEVAHKAINLFCKEQVYPHITYKLWLRIPDALYLNVAYIEVQGKPLYSCLVGSMGQYRTAFKLTDVPNEYRDRIEQMLRMR